MIIPAPTFNRWVAEHSVWLITCCTETVRRYARKRCGPLNKAIVADPGRSREVISRLPRDFEREGLVAPSRSLIRLQDDDSLRLPAGRL